MSQHVHGFICREDDHGDTLPRRFTPRECEVAAGALLAAALMVDDVEASDQLLELAHQWRDEATA